MGTELSVPRLGQGGRGLPSPGAPCPAPHTSVHSWQGVCPGPWVRPSRHGAGSAVLPEPCPGPGVTSDELITDVTLGTVKTVPGHMQPVIRLISPHEWVTQRAAPAQGWGGGCDMGRSVCSPFPWQSPRLEGVTAPRGRPPSSRLPRPDFLAPAHPTHPLWAGLGQVSSPEGQR